MRIVYVTTTLPYAEGEAFIIPEIVALARRGHQVLIVPRSGNGEVVHGDAEPLLSMTLARSLLSFEIVKAAGAESCRDPGRALRAAGLLFHSLNPRILLKNLAVFAKGLWLARMAREWGATHIHAHWSATVATIALTASEVAGIPWSFTAHRFDIVENNLLALKSRRASFVRFISHSGMRMARSLGVDGPKEKFRVLHMGVDLPELATGLSACACSPVLLCPGNLLPVKGHKYLIEAVAILKKQGLEVRLLIAGQGELCSRLQKQVQESRLCDQVRFLGQISHSELLGLYRDGNIGMVVLPSIDLGNGEHEGIPVSLIEAMSYGVPVVSTLTGGIPELLKDGAGLLVPPGDPLALAAAIELLIKDSRLRDQLAEAGRKRVMDEYSVEKIIDELAAHFEQ
jgi:glycosyltransferase involved in cell wall biosynthesis